ncbi:MAG: caspase family protein, partial [Nitrospinota bacterium]|nr:caspase family protein [Nitrospinota bacterium]
WALILSIALILGATPTHSGVPSIKFGSYHALVIGNNAYRNVKPLRTAVNDARAVANFLRNSYGFQVTLLTDATRGKILSALEKMRRQLTEGDNLLIYYAGHGVLDKEADRGYWLPVNAKSDSQIEWISTTRITDTLKAITARHVMIVADSCYSGALVRDIRAVVRSGGERKVYLSRMVKKRSRTVLTSGGLEPVLDSGGGNHSVFAKAFLSALRENDGVIEGQELFMKLRRPVIVNSPQTPEYADIRFAGHDGGDFLFVRNRRAAEEKRKEEAHLAVLQRELEAEKARLKKAEEARRLKEQIARLRKRREQIESKPKAPAKSAPKQQATYMPGGKHYPKTITGSDGAPMVLVPAGNFIMGSNSGGEKP